MLYWLSPRERSPREREKEKRIFRIEVKAPGGAFSIGRLRRPSSSSVNNFQFITKQRIPDCYQPIARQFPSLSPEYYHFLTSLISVNQKKQIMIF